MSDQPSKTRVLVIEDEQELADLYSAWLADSYEVRTAYGGAQALDVVDESVDVALLDRRMPDMSGDMVLNEIREQGYACRVAMVTAVEPGLDIIEMGFDDYLTKPVSKDELHETVQRLLTLATYDKQLHELYTLATKKAVLENRQDDIALDENDEYADLEERLTDHREQLASTLAELEDDDETDPGYFIGSLLRGSIGEDGAVQEIAKESG